MEAASSPRRRSIQRVRQHIRGRVKTQRETFVAADDVMTHVQTKLRSVTTAVDAGIHFAARTD